VRHNIQAYKEIEAALRASERRSRSTLDNIWEGCQIIGFDWRYLYINPAAAEQGKQIPEALLGRTMMDVYPGIEQTDLFATLQQCMQARVPAQLENEFVFPDGSRGSYELRIQPVPEGLLIFSFNITNHEEDKATLRQSKSELQHVIDTAPEGVLLLTPDGHVQLTNPVAVNHLTHLAPDWQTKPLTALGNRPLPELLTSPPKGMWHEITLSDRIFEVIARPMEMSAANSGWVFVIYDATQEREIRRQGRRQERLATVGIWQPVLPMILTTSWLLLPSMLNLFHAR
jgi:PAS domain-containing protein